MSHLDLPKGHREDESAVIRTIDAVKAEATSVRRTATEYPASTVLLLGLVGVAAFLLGHAAGYRSAEADIRPPSRRFW